MENSQRSHTFPLEDRRADALGNLKSLPDELICTILDYVTPRDIARLACVISFCVMYIFCNEEQLWMSLCLKKVNDPLQYKVSWKKTALHLENLPNEYVEYCRKPLQFGYSVCDGLFSGFTMMGGLSSVVPPRDASGLTEML
ncbi:Transferases, transferring glycosyl groups, putative isoform 1 [Theobroma cacao]|uniref:Transferases, transferring glycosyl groups, putative isoform 1 n=1 Tax=Theobroma cacao TaxID=3641 RepID=A0A061GL54_THECC|nr:Transferases, transferring glycosyl groups, putative isoform 1 [Theobroma cacao]